MALTESDIRNAAASIGVPPAAVKAVVEVESRGNGFLLDGRPRILFEGHVFWKQLKQRRIDPVPLSKTYPTIVYPSWDRSKYRPSVEEWGRLNLAIHINREAALCSASWGLFQIMGFNHALCGYKSVEEFVTAQSESEGNQLTAFCVFIESQRLAKYLVRKDWAAFAAAYNGDGYALNRYDTKLASEYAKAVKAGF
ncbi:MAG: N-acetylmuramidase family protein [Desulfovibrio sp.]|jgi:hypothetical protein|nr:N-acetylmuramidase family protein [Desulfovibrio sp.]